MMTGISNETQFYTPETSLKQGVLYGSVLDEPKRTSEMDVSSLGKDDFLKLLIAQLQNQDPLNPASNTEFVAQLAQFSTLEQLTTMNSSLEQSLEFNKSVSESINNSMMVNFFGKYVSAELNEFTFDGTNPVTLNYELDRDISRGTIEVLDRNGITIRSFILDELDVGPGSKTWDGMTVLGVFAESGKYTYNLTAFDSVGNEVNASPVFTGVVDGISYRDGKAHLDIAGVLVPFDTVKHIIENEE